jgi:hypothetical protein
LPLDNIHAGQTPPAFGNDDRMLDVAIVGLGSSGVSAASSLLGMSDRIRITAYEANKSNIGGGVGFHTSTPSYHELLFGLKPNLLPRSTSKFRTFQPCIQKLIDSQKNKAYVQMKNSSRRHVGDMGKFILDSLPPDKCIVLNHKVTKSRYIPEPGSDGKKFKIYSVGKDNKVEVRRYHAVIYAMKDVPKMPSWLERYHSSLQVAASFWDDIEKAKRVLSRLAGDPEKTLLVAGGGLTSREAIMHAIIESGFKGNIKHIAPHNANLPGLRTQQQKWQHFLEPLKGRYEAVLGKITDLRIVDNRLTVSVLGKSDTEEICGDAFISAIGRTTKIAELEDAADHDVLERPSERYESKNKFYTTKHPEITGPRIHNGKYFLHNGISSLMLRYYVEWVSVLERLYPMSKALDATTSPLATLIA